MDTGDREASRSSRPLEYAARLPPAVRTSRLAVASLAAAVLGSPCLLGPLSNWLNWHLPQAFGQAGRYGAIHVWAIRGAMVLATALPVLAIVRIGLSRRIRAGAGVAVLALLVSLLWWGLAYLGELMWRGFRMG
jgi:hypothetical protein